MGLHIIHALLECIGERLQNIRVSIQVALLHTVGRVGHVAGSFAERGNHIAFALLLQSGGSRFKFHCVISRRTISGKGGSGRAKIDALVNGQVRSRINAILFQNIFKYHFRHTACPAAIYIGSFQICPPESIRIGSGYKKISGPLGQLGEIHQIIIGILIVNVNRRFASHETNVRFAGYNSGGGLVSTKSGDQGQIDSLVLEITVFNCHILGSIENRMCHFI